MRNETEAYKYSYVVPRIEMLLGKLQLELRMGPGSTFIISKNGTDYNIQSNLETLYEVLAFLKGWRMALGIKLRNIKMVKIHKSKEYGFSFVRLAEIEPEAKRKAFGVWLNNQTVPYLPEEGSIAYSWDWEKFSDYYDCGKIAPILD